MDQTREQTPGSSGTHPVPRLAPLAADRQPDLAPQFAASMARAGFVANSLLVMQRKPAIVKALTQLSAAIWTEDGEVDSAFKRLIAHVCSRASGCQYCVAHTAAQAVKLGTAEARLAEVWSYATSPLFTPAERAALDVAIGAGCVPNAVTDEMFDTLKAHWTETQIVEIVAVIALFGFLNRWNDTLATPLEEAPLSFARDHLTAQGWDAGKHAV